MAAHQRSAAGENNGGDSGAAKRQANNMQRRSETAAASAEKAARHRRHRRGGAKIALWRQNSGSSQSLALKTARGAGTKMKRQSKRLAAWRRKARAAAAKNMRR